MKEIPAKEKHMGREIELLSDELGYLTEIYKESVKNMAWFLLAAYSKTQEDKDN